jgi:DNA-binding transcriptional ArsR family regulator
LYDEKSMLVVTAPEITAKSKQIEFEFKARDLPDDKKPVMEFEWKNKKFQPLDSDTLLRVCVKEFDLEPDTVQATLEHLYYSGWINYPRADVIKATDEPIFTLRDPSEFKGTKQEKDMLDLIYKSESSNYIKTGEWVLKYGDEEIARTDGYVLGEPSILEKPFTHDQFDIRVERKGVTKEMLTDYLTFNNVNTPATRTMQLRELKEAGIISIVERDGERFYQLDKRGIILKAAYDYYDKNSFNALELLREVDETDSVNDYKIVLKKIKPMPRDKAANIIAKRADELLEKQDDLAELDNY